MHNNRKKTVALLGLGLILIIVVIGAICAGSADTTEDGVSSSMFLVAGAYLVLTMSLVGILKTDKSNQIIKQHKFNYWPFVIIFVGFTMRIFTGYMVVGYESDMACWTTWSQAAAGKGIFKIYTSGIFIDYPPGYVYILHILGSLGNLLGLDTFTSGYNLILKMPAIVADMILVWVIYFVASKKFNRKTANLLTLFYAVNPLVIMNSAGWGQVDGLLTLLVILYIITLRNKNIVKASIIFTIGILVKPQMIFFGPVLAVVFIKHVINSGIRKGIPIFVKGFGLSILLFTAVVLPFSAGQKWTWIFDKYFGVVGSYNFITLNSANIYGLLGMNWKSLTAQPEGTALFIIAIVAMVISVVIYFVLSLLDKKDSHIFMLSAVLMTGIYVLGPKMHERYIFPVAAIFLASYIYEDNIMGLSLSGIISAAAFMNCAQVLATIYIPPKDPTFIITSLIISLMYFLMISFCAYEIIKKRRMGKTILLDT